MPGIDELLRSEGALWRAEIDAHETSTEVSAEAHTRPRRVRAWGSTRAKVWTVSVAGVAAAAVAVLAVGLGSGSGGSSSGTVNGDAAGGGAASAASIPSDAKAASGAVPALGGGSSASGSPGSGATGSGSTGAPVGSTALIVTGSMSVIVRDNAAVDAAATRAAGIAGRAGGRVDTDDRQTASRHSATLVLRVPNAALSGVTTQLGRLGTVSSQQRQVKDVTGQVADVNSRVASARAAIAGLTRLYAKARTVGELITVESALAARQSNLEALQAQQRALSGQTALATLTVSIEVRSPTASHHAHRGGFVGGLQRGWHAFTRTGIALGAGFGAALPFLAVLLVIGVGGLVVARRRARG